LKIQDGGVGHLETHRNRDICATALPIFTNLVGLAMQNGSCKSQPLQPLKNLNFKNPKTPDGRNFETR